MPTLNWQGKEKIINHHLTVPLRMLKEEPLYSCSFQGKSGNMIVAGDNLEVLKALEQQHGAGVKCIYIDPPYNTGYQKWHYNDNANSPELQRWLEQTVGEEVVERHDKWLCMIYPRLKLMHRLLRDDGFIFVSIDNNELHNLRHVMGEIFGEENYVNTIVVKRAAKNLNNQFKELRTLNQAFEYLLVFRKSERALWTAPRGDSIGKRKEGYWTSFWNNADRPTMRYELLGKTIDRGQWKWSRSKAMQAVENYRQYQKNYSDRCTLKEYWEMTGKKEKFIRRKGENIPQYWVEPSDTRLLDTNWMDLYVNDSKYKRFFDTPKSLKLVKRIIRSATAEGDLVLDCFAGSGTTGHAVLEVNREDKTARRFILVEINEYVREVTAGRVRSAIQELSTGEAEDEYLEGFCFYRLGNKVKDPSCQQDRGD